MSGVSGLGGSGISAQLAALEQEREQMQLKSAAKGNKVFDDNENKKHIDGRR